MTSAELRAEQLNARVVETAAPERKRPVSHCPHPDNGGGVGHEGGHGENVVCCWCGLRGSRWTSYNTRRIENHGPFAMETVHEANPIRWPVEECDATR